MERVNIFIMEPREKARELIKLMRRNCYCNAFPTDRNGVSRKVTTYKIDSAIECSLIAVDAILSALTVQIGVTTPTHKFYEQVKIELNEALNSVE